MFSGRILCSPKYRPNQSAEHAPHQTKHPIKRQLFAPSHPCAKTTPKSPTNNLSEPEHTNSKTFLEIFDSAKQKILPIHVQLSQHQQKSPPTSYPIRNTSIQKTWKNQKALDKKFHLLQLTTVH
jgi:hypothetical protein